MAFVDIHDNSIDAMTRKRSYAEWLIKNGEDKREARVRAHQRIMWIIATDENLPDGERRKAWVSYYISRGEGSDMARLIACRLIPK
jgi:hypothetical protein